VPWLAICFLVALLVPIAMQLVDAHFPAGKGWEATSEFSRLQARAGLPWWLAAWLFPLAYFAAMAALASTFELLLFGLRLDRGDHAWSAMRWTLRGWRAPILWVLVPIVVLELAIFAIDPDISMGVLVFVPWFVYLVHMLLPFFLLKVEYLGSEEPALVSQPRWPGMLPVFLWLVVPVLVPLLSMLIPWSDMPWPTQWLATIVIVLALLFVPLIAQLAWLNPGADLKASARRAFQPRVLLPWLVQAWRWYAWLPIVFLAFLPVGLLFTHALPTLEAQFLELGALGLMPMIKASRFVQAWWWMNSMVVIAVFQLCIGWYGIAGGGRLLVELGEARDSTARAI